MAQIPRGEENLFCPFWQKPQSEVCHKCPLWVQIRGKDPQGTKEIDAWGCSLMWLPKLIIEAAQASHQTGASVDKVANEVRQASDQAAVRDVHLINGIRASFPLIRMTQENIADTLASERLALRDDSNDERQQ